MKECKKVRLGSVCSFLNGGTPSRSIESYFRGEIPWITSADINGPVVSIARSYITEEAIRNSSTTRVPPGTILLVTRTSVGKVAIAGMSLCFSQDITALIPDVHVVHTPYLVHFLKTQESHFDRFARGATIKGITRQIVEDLVIPLPPLSEQRHIAAILDKADAVRRKRRQAIQLADEFLRSVFLDMFGDPVINPKGWEMKAFGDIADKFSDGPFGSNLKSSHYATSGVRVVRLQNVGIGKFIDIDKAYISEDHFKSLTSHDCRPGDVLIGTLGEPNLRACLLPSYIRQALNKADCIQLRPATNRATSEYVCTLINHPGMLTLASHLLHGQTRTRVSMGTLRELLIPVPPVSLQKRFSGLYYQVHKLLMHQNKAAEEEGELFNSLTQRAFSGEL